MQYPLLQAVRRSPAPTATEEAGARMCQEVLALGKTCLRRGLLFRIYRFTERGEQALAPLIAHFGWTRVAEGQPMSDDERDALEEMLLLAFHPTYPLIPRGELVVQLFALLQDTPRFTATRLGKKCVGVEVYRLCTQILQVAQCTDHELNLLLAVWLRDRMCARKCVRDTNAGLRLHRRDRAVMARRLGIG